MEGTFVPSSKLGMPVQEVVNETWDANVPFMSQTQTPLTATLPALQLHVYVLTPFTHVPALPQGLPAQLLISVHPDPLTVPSPVKPEGQVQVPPPGVLEGSLHVAMATHGVAVHWLTVGTHWPFELMYPPVQAQVGGVPSVHPVAFGPHESPLPVQVPAVHTSVAVQARPSLHAVPSVTGDAVHVPAVHTPVLHWSVLLVQTIGVPAHRPAEHVSPVVHGSPSSHVAVLFWCLQPRIMSQLSSVHGLPSSQLTAVPPVHTPVLQVEPAVHALLLQAPPSAVVGYTHVAPPAQVEAVVWQAAGLSQAVAQQMPLTQCPVPQSPSTLQVPPCAAPPSGPPSAVAPPSLAAPPSWLASGPASEATPLSGVTPLSGPGTHSPALFTTSPVGQPVEVSVPWEASVLSPPLESAFSEPSGPFSGVVPELPPHPAVSSESRNPTRISLDVVSMAASSTIPRIAL
jgi:hypothetical protein